METGATGRTPAAGVRPAAVAGALAAATAISLLLRVGALHTGYWIDEGIAVGIASHPLGDIPGALVQDGSPPLYYLLLHAWIGAFGVGEAATRSLSLLFALAAVPLSFWAGRRLFGTRAGAIAAAGAAGCPFLTLYAQETRMYALVALLSLLAGASFVLAFLHGSRRHLVLLGVWLELLLYTHNWGLFLALGMAVAWLRLWRRGRVPGRDGAWLAAAVAAVYAPWLPSVVFQAAHTGAPWAQRPSPLLLLAVPGALFGYVAYGALVVALARERALRRVEEPVRVLALVAATTAAAAWAFSQVDPAWSTRYLAVLFGPVLLALAAVLARGSRWTVAALLCVAVAWLLGGPAGGKSNVRRVAAHISPQVRAGDLVVSTQPEQVPVLDRYLPGGLTYVTPLGAVTDPRVVDWRDGLPRLRHGRADRVLLPWVDGLPAGRRVLLVTPVFAHGKARAPWLRAVRARTREWRVALHADPRLHEIATVARAALPRRRSTVRAELFEVAGNSAAVDAAGRPVADHRQR